MVHAYHFIFSGYGFWLPNDPRGSWSEVVRQFDLLAFGPATKTTSTRSVAASPHDNARRRAAKEALLYPPVRFDGKQCLAISQGFQTACEESGYQPLALATLPDHMHLVLLRHSRHVDQIAAHLKAKATARLTAAHLNPMRGFVSAKGRKPSPWSRNHWCPFLDSSEAVHRAIHYVNDNPVKAGLPTQCWKFIRPYHA